MKNKKITVDCSICSGYRTLQRLEIQEKVEISKKLKFNSRNI